jgi:hypothetical protein
VKPVCFELTLAVRRAGLKPRISARDDLPHFRLSLLERERERERDCERVGRSGGEWENGEAGESTKREREIERSRERERAKRKRKRERREETYCVAISEWPVDK